MYIYHNCNNILYSRFFGFVRELSFVIMSVAYMQRMDYKKDQENAPNALFPLLVLGLTETDTCSSLFESETCSCNSTPAH